MWGRTCCKIMRRLFRPITRLNKSSSTSTTNTGDYRVEFFATPTCDDSDHGQADRYLGALTVAAGTNQTITLAAASFAPGDNLVTTATQLQGTSRGNTSEFSECHPITLPTAITLNTHQITTKSSHIILAITVLLFAAVHLLRYRLSTR